MDFDSRFECCKVCNSISFQCQNNRSPRHIQGQGDCKCTNEGCKNVWMTVDKGKTQRNKCDRDHNQSESERPKNFLDGHCYCFTRQDFPDKLNWEPKQENYETCKYFWDSSPPNWTSKSETFFIPEQHKRSDYANPDKALTEKISKFEEKVDFLFRIFKDYGQKFPPEGDIEQGQTKPGEGVFKEFAQLFHFDKRLCAAEEGIEKMAHILEDLVKESSRKKTDSYEDPVDFDEMSVSQRISYLKSRNDLMLSFMKAFFKSGSAEEYYTKFALVPNDVKSQNTKLDHGENHQNTDLNHLKMMETLQKLRMRITELRRRKTQFYTEQQKTGNEKKEETVAQHAKSKLEVISEHAELDLSEDSDFDEKGAVRLLSEKMAEIDVESDESDFSVQDVTLRILPQDSDSLKPSIENLYSKLDSSEKKFLNKGNIQISLKEEKQQGNVHIKCDSASELSCFFCEGGISDKTRERNKAFTKQKEPGKREKNSPERSTNDPCKQNISKKAEEYHEGHTPSRRKILQEETYVVFPRKGNASVPELSSPSRKERKSPVRRKEEKQRPMTDPSSHRKSLLASKPPLPNKYATRNSGINNVKSKNKILLSKKSCVQTS